MATLELDAPPTPRSILVIKGLRITMEQSERLRDQIHEAVNGNTWPVIMAGDFDDVYWLPIESPPLREFVDWAAGLTQETSFGLSLDDVAFKAQEALEKAGVES